MHYGLRTDRLSWQEPPLTSRIKIWQVLGRVCAWPVPREKFLNAPCYDQDYNLLLSWDPLWKRPPIIKGLIYSIRCSVCTWGRHFWFWFYSHHGHREDPPPKTSVWKTQCVLCCSYCQFFIFEVLDWRGIWILAAIAKSVSRPVALCNTECNSVMGGSNSLTQNGVQELHILGRKRNIFKVKVT